MYFNYRKSINILMEKHIITMSKSTAVECA